MRSTYTGDDTDPYQDGLSNLLEYALHTDPNDPTQSAPISTESNANTFSLIYPKNQDASDVTYTMEVSSAPTFLVSWSQAAMTETILITRNGTEWVKASYSLNGVERQLFLRLRITRKQQRFMKKTDFME